MRLPAVLALGLFLASGAAFASGPYDGNWSGTVMGAGHQCMGGSVTLNIVNNTVSGIVDLAEGTAGIQGSVAADGALKATYTDKSTDDWVTLTGKVSGSDFAGNLATDYPDRYGACTRSVGAKRF
jgi:hypothetical protein